MKTLESNKVFPFLAWGAIIVGGLAVVYMAHNLDKQLNGLSSSTNTTETVLSNNGMKVPNQK